MVAYFTPGESRPRATSCFHDPWLVDRPSLYRPGYTSGSPRGLPRGSARPLPARDGTPEPWYPEGVKKVSVAKKTRVKARKTLAVGRSSSVRRSDSFSEAKLLLNEIIEENLETFKLLARY